MQEGIGTVAEKRNAELKRAPLLHVHTSHFSRFLTVPTPAMSMKKRRLSIRDIMFTVLVFAVALAWYSDHRCQLEKQAKLAVEIRNLKLSSIYPDERLASYLEIDPVNPTESEVMYLIQGLSDPAFGVTKVSDQKLREISGRQKPTITDNSVDDRLRAMAVWIDWFLSEWRRDRATRQ